MLMKLDGSISPQTCGLQAVTRVAVRMKDNMYEFLPLTGKEKHVANAARYIDLPSVAQVLCDHELVGWLLMKGHGWRRRCTSAMLTKTHTHVLVFDGDRAYVAAIGTVQNRGYPLFESFCAGPFCDRINLLIAADKRRSPSDHPNAHAMGEIFLIGMSQPARIH